LRRTHVRAVAQETAPLILRQRGAWCVGSTPRPHPGLILVTTVTVTVTVISKTGYQLIASHHIDPDRNYWRNQQKNPGRWPGNL
jgi:hypothetical protein